MYLLYFLSIIFIIFIIFKVSFLLRSIGRGLRGKEEFKMFLNEHPAFKKEVREEFYEALKHDSYGEIGDVIDKLRKVVKNEFHGVDREAILDVLEHNTKEGTINCVQEFLVD